MTATMNGDVAVIPGYGENPPQEAALPPHPEAGGDAPPEGKTWCEHCSQWISTANYQQHLLRNHEIGRKRPYKARPGTTVTKPKAKEQSTEVAVAEPVLKTGLPTTDDLLATIVELRWPHTMPTKKALEMLEIRSALAKFLQ